VDTGGTNSFRAHGLAGRYATALFDLAREAKSLDTVEKGLGALKAALGDSAELKALTTSPLVGRDAAASGIAAVAKAMKLDSLTANFLGVLAKNRRLAALPAIIAAFNGLAAHHRGEVTAEVTSAHKLSAAQTDALKAKLKAGLKRDVALDLAVDPAILGGLVVKVGSRMVDSSIRTKLGAIGQAMKG